MKRILSIFIILFLLVLPITATAIVCPPLPETPGGDWIFPGSMCDNVLVVCPTSEYTTITEAMAAAADGDTIMVTEGTYTEAVVFSQDNITLKAFGSPENTIITQAAGTTVSFSTTSGCTLDGFTVTLSAATANTDEAIFSANDSTTDYNTVKNCIITVNNAGASTFGLYGIDINDGNFWLENNRITITQSNDQAVYAIWNTGAHTSKYIGNDLTIDQNATGAFMSSGFQHLAGAGSIMYCKGNTIDITSDHTLASIAHGVYAAAEINFVDRNIIDVEATGTGAAYGLWTTTAKTLYAMGNNINVLTGDSDGQWANIANGTAYLHANIAIGDGILGTGGTIYTGLNQVNGTSIGTIDNTVIGGTTPGTLYSKFATVEKSADTVELTANECSGTLITNRGWDGADDQTFTFPAAVAGLKCMFQAVVASGGTADTYFDTEGATTNNYLDGTAVGDGVRIWTQEIAVGESIFFYTFTIDGTNYEWASNTINGVWEDKGS